MNRHNAAIFLLSSRVKLLEECLKNLYKNWNYQYNYPIYIHYFDNIYSDRFKNNIKKKISPNIYFHQIDYKMPSNINEKDLFYNRTYLEYVRKSFSKKRIGYLHMCNFCTNFTLFGQSGSPVKELSKFDKLMRIDDDSYFKSKITFDLFDILETYPFATGYTWSKYDFRTVDTRENLWKFYKQYINDEKITPKSLILQDALKNDDEKMMHNLKWSAGNLNLYNMKIILKNPNWEKYLKKINAYGGIYKHRWGDIECIDLFFQTHICEPYDLKLKDKKLYDNKFPTVLSHIAPSVGSYFNVHHFPLLRYYHQFLYWIKNLKNKN